MLKDFHTDFETIDVTITGKMVKVSAVLDDAVIMNMGRLPQQDKDYIREQLAMQLASFLMENNMIEYTQMSDPTNFKTRIMGRIFVTPNGDTKLIRTLKR